MPELVVPHPRLQASYLDLWAELDANGEDAASWLNWGDERTASDLADPDEFAAWVDHVNSRAWTPDSKLARGLVRSTALLWVEGDRVLGRLNLRHDLTEYLLEQGGHIGYVVRPSERRRGHASAMLRAALPLAGDLGLPRVLITCDDDNEASARVIEACGGVLEDVRGDKRRYWVRTPERWPQPLRRGVDARTMTS